nr:MAG TPA: hypothetical protein [Caudoviricetes sp.]
MPISGGKWLALSTAIKRTFVLFSFYTRRCPLNNPQYLLTDKETR